MDSIELSIIIVNWHSADYVMACVSSIYEQTNSVDYEIIVVDNGSFDGCKERLAKEYPDVIFVESKTNLGFGGANNLGASLACGTVLLFLNPDTVILDRAIERLYECLLSLPNVGVVGCRLLNADGSLQTSCVQPMPTVLNQVLDVAFLHRMFPAVSLWTNAARYEGRSGPIEVEALSGACLMLLRKVFYEIGGFTSEYFMYTEDLDLCLKARKAGRRNYYVPEVAILHHSGGSSRRAGSNFSVVMMRESIYRFLCRYRGRLYAICYRTALLLAAVVREFLLFMLLPIYLVFWGKKAWLGSYKKWLAILGWGMGICHCPQRVRVGDLCGVIMGKSKDKG
ncbi:MAG: glycosyltransferase family 2 protein [Candidatus Bathyarchaeia archaeon]